MRKLRHVALLLAAALWAAPVQAVSLRGPVISITEDSGGEIIAYLLRTAEAREQNAQVHIDGRCDSACTLFLSLPPRQLCLGAGAYFRFHLPIADDPETVREAAGILTQKYPRWVNAWIAQNNGLTENLLTMSYEQAHQHIRACPTEEGAASLPADPGSGIKHG